LRKAKAQKNKEKEDETGKEVSQKTNAKKEVFARSDSLFCITQGLHESDCSRVAEMNQTAAMLSAASARVSVGVFVKVGPQ
jgi:hypothetical protein